MRSGFLLLLSCFLCTCTRTATQLLVVVDTDFPVPMRMARLRVSTLLPDGSRTVNVPMEWELRARESSQELTRFSFPLSFGVAAKDTDRNGQVRLRVEGLSASNQVLVRREIRTNYREGRVLSVPMFLGLVCGGVECSMRDEACKPPNGRCESIDEDSRTYTEIPANAPAGIEFDGGMTASVDAGVDAATDTGTFSTVAPCSRILGNVAPGFAFLSRNTSALPDTSLSLVSERPVVASSDGQSVVFLTSSAFSGWERFSGGEPDLYRYDYRTNELCLVSGVNGEAVGAQEFTSTANGDSIGFVAARGAVGGRVFVYSSDTRATMGRMPVSLVPLLRSDEQAFQARSIVLSPEGALVGITTEVSLLNEDTNNALDSYRRNLFSTGAWEWLRGERNDSVRVLAMSSGGQSVLLAVQELVAGTMRAELFLQNRMTATIRRVAARNDGSAGNTAPEIRTAMLRSNGENVLFESAASDLVEGDTNGRNDVFLADVTRNPVLLTRVSAPLDGVVDNVSGATMSLERTVVAFVGVVGTEQRCYVWRANAGTQVIHRPGTSEPLQNCLAPALSPNGELLYFYTRQDLAPEDNDGAVDLYRIPVP